MAANSTGGRYSSQNEPATPPVEATTPVTAARSASTSRIASIGARSRAEAAALVPPASQVSTEATTAPTALQA